ncbi:Replication-associated protein G2P [Shewanella maritima]|uniref:Replication-associated protein G2P n=1 Tax=Shewanella maritima TaxID=2520507 RepID=A0A411PCJ3_9GAMM|nr:phage/plasmid replication protein, II/X family [Shewanella maritima]QBF81280.1 Replication-associated protein G2P [Shewanella maritima]QBF81288.1 Replication-associated protein G2P [Shewanella maritima]QBF81297.1 Replication-associated protein G2P [Shewanella maritima]QBF81307.1 Replication-associated protein G2P [Shewanella maritima]QBF81316.1 Replication-associated protein G2P [Shewanella maritima]
MIDWATVEIALEHEPIASDRFIKVKADGEIEYETVCRNRIQAGSYESSISIRSLGSNGQGKATHLQIDGNPSKFTQGHNVFGINHLLPLVSRTFKVITGYLQIDYTDQEFWAVQRGHYRITRIDINESFELDNLLSVRSWLKAAELKSKTRHGRPTSKGGTVYWGQNSRRWAIKAYCKYDEINSGKKHQLPDELKNTKIPKWAESKLRIELVLRGMELAKLEIKQGADLTPERIEELYNAYLGRLEMSKNVTLTDSSALNLPRKLQSTYMLWTQGHDLKTLLPRTTFYRQRKELLEHDIDINMSCDQPNQTNVVPLLKVLEAKPVSTPAWAFNEGLVLDPTSDKTHVGYVLKKVS